MEWLCDFLQDEGIEVTPHIKSLIREALSTLSSLPKEHRTISTFKDYLQNEHLKQAIAPMTMGNEYGSIFDSNIDTLELSSWQSFEMGKIINKQNIIGPVLMYIFHRIENMLKGYDGHDVTQDGPTLIVLDECWMFFKNPLFGHFLYSPECPPHTTGHIPSPS